MAQPLYIMEAVDVRRADTADSSRVLTISRLTLPEIRRKTANFAPGGGIGEVAFVLPQIDPISPKFELKGIDTDMLAGFGFTAGTWDKWTFAGSLRKKQGGTSVPARAIIQGSIQTWTPDQFAIGEMMGCNYEIAEVTHYEVTIEGQEIWYWDFYEREGRAGGVSWFNDTRLALGV